MAKIDETYHNLLKEIVNTGTLYEDPNRKGNNRLEIPRYSFYHSFENGFPAITTKKLAWKSVVGETIWILRGDTNIKYLVDNNIPIWNKDAYNYYKNLAPQSSIKPVDIITLGSFTNVINQGRLNYEDRINNYKLGDLGRGYGYQLRNFGGEFDQLKWIIDEMKNNPLSTKKDVTYINPNDREYQGLTPCHTGFSIIMRKDLSGFDLEFKMSSWDVFLGAPFNIAGYALIAKILEKVTGHKALGLYCTAHNVHIYEPHLDAVKEQLSRDVDKYGECELETEISLHNQFALFNNKELSLNELLNEFDIEDFNLKGYKSDPRIPAEMLAYNK